MILKGLVDHCAAKVYSISHKSLPQTQYTKIATPNSPEPAYSSVTDSGQVVIYID